MQNPDKNILEQQKKAAAFLTRRRIPFEPKSAETLSAEAKVEAEEQARIETEFWENTQPGDAMPDGTIYAGLSPETGNRMFAMQADADIAMNFNQAAKYTATINAEKTLGYNNWRLPNEKELDILLKNHNKGKLRGTFSVADLDDTSWYRSSTEYCRCFYNGQRMKLNPERAFSIRFIRT